MAITPFEKKLKAEKEKMIRERQLFEEQANWYRNFKTIIKLADEVGGTNTIEVRSDQPKRIKAKEAQIDCVPKAAATARMAIFITLPRRFSGGVMQWGGDIIRRPHRRRKMN